jgi:catechol 1,2-dioxygenase
MRRIVASSRRRFLQGTLALTALPFAPLAGAACVAPLSNILGPAYRKGAPFRSHLCGPHEIGTPLTMRGRIVDAASCAALAGVVLDVWQVDIAGDYDMDSPAFHLRGKMRSTADGSYAFDTIMPVPYGRRPKHIHYLLTHAGYEPRITQCYFAGDERNAHDPYVKPELIITPRDKPRVEGALEGTLDVALEREQSPSAADVDHYADFLGSYQIAAGVTVTISQDARHLHWHLSAAEDDGDALDGVLIARGAARFFIPEYDMTVTFVRDEHGKVSHALNSHGDLMKKVG